MTPEDEAFDDLARKQGMWGGGFKAKRQAAMHKTQDQNICRHYKQWQHCHICDLESQVAELASIKAILDEYGLQAIDFVADFKAALAQPVQEPVAQGSKEHLKIMMEHSAWDDRLELSDALANIDEFYANAPPKRPWVGLTEEDFSAINQSCLTKLQAATSAESILKEKNS